MDIEIRMLAWAVVLGLVQLLLAAAGMTLQRGVKWNASARDGEARPLAGVPGRLDRAWRNFLETFPFFAAAVEAATEGWPEPVRSSVPVNVTVPAVDAERAHAIAAASGCRTAKVKIAEPGQTEADDLTRVEAVRDALDHRFLDEIDDLAHRGAGLAGQCGTVGHLAGRVVDQALDLLGGSG